MTHTARYAGHKGERYVRKRFYLSGVAFLVSRFLVSLMTYRATLYYTGGRTESVSVKAKDRNEAHGKLRKLPGWECVKLEEVR